MTIVYTPGTIELIREIRLDHGRKARAATLPDRKRSISANRSVTAPAQIAEIIHATPQHLYAMQQMIRAHKVLRAILAQSATLGLFSRLTDGSTWKLVARRNPPMKEAWEGSLFFFGTPSASLTVQAMKAAAIELLTKPFRDQDLMDRTGDEGSDPVSAECELAKM